MPDFKLYWQGWGKDQSQDGKTFLPVMAKSLAWFPQNLLISPFSPKLTYFSLASLNWLQSTSRDQSRRLTSTTENIDILYTTFLSCFSFIIFHLTFIQQGLKLFLKVFCISQVYGSILSFEIVGRFKTRSKTKKVLRYKNKWSRGGEEVQHA